MTNNNQQYKITAGPSREELFDGLRLRHEKRTIVFTVINTVKMSSPPRQGAIMEAPETINVHVDGISIEDGSGNNWLLRLYDPENRFGSKHLRAYFNTTRREGWIRPEVQ